MNMKNEVTVMINKKEYTLTGYESEEYLQKIANFINAKYSEFSKIDGYSLLEGDHKNVLMQINLADAYYKVLEERDSLKKELEEKNKEIFDLKHELVSKKEEERGKKRR